MLYTKVCAVIAAVLLTIYAVDAPQAGFWDSTFLPMTYVALAASVLVAAFKPSRGTLLLAASIGMAKGTVRAWTLLIANQNWGGWAFHSLFTLMVYVIWRAYRDELAASEAMSSKSP